jgi:ERAP1-like C-terminal domain
VTPRAGENNDDKNLRERLLRRLVVDGEDAALQQQMLRLAWRWLDDRKSLPPELIGTVLGLAAYGGDARLYERYLAEARAAHQKHDKPERVRFLRALGSFRDPALEERTRALALGDEFPALETMGLIDVGSDTRAGREADWKFLMAHYEVIRARRPPETRAGLVGVGSDCTRASFERSKAFFAERTPKELSGPRTWQAFLEGQTLCIARHERDRDSFIELLSGR